MIGTGRIYVCGAGSGEICGDGGGDERWDCNGGCWTWGDDIRSTEIYV